MALYVLTCDKCGSVSKRLFSTEAEANTGKPCKVTGCDGVGRRTPSAPTLHNKEVLAMPHQIKTVERFSDATKLYEERSKKDYSKPD